MREDRNETTLVDLFSLPLRSPINCQKYPIFFHLLFLRSGIDKNQQQDAISIGKQPEKRRFLVNLSLLEYLFFLSRVADR